MRGSLAQRLASTRASVAWRNAASGRGSSSSPRNIAPQSIVRAALLVAAQE